MTKNKNERVVSARRRPPMRQQSGGQADRSSSGIREVRAGRGREELRRGGHQPQRGTSRASAARARGATARSTSRGRKELTPCGGSRPQRRGPGPNPNARQAGAPRARPPRATSVMPKPNMRCRRGCPTSPQWRYCPFCGNPLPPQPPQQPHTNSHRTLRAGTANDGPSLNARFPPRATGGTPSRRTVNATISNPC